MKKVLITGAGGFVGNHLKEFLDNQGGLEIIGVDRNNLDLTDNNKVSDFLTNLQPDYVFHLAALTSPAKSFTDPYTTFDNNIRAEINILEGLKNNRARILIIGSGDEYGKVSKDENPITEEQPLRPTNPYAVSKIAQDYLALQYVYSYKMNIIRVRPFNHIGQGQKPYFVVPAFAKQIAEIEAGKKDAIINVGNLSAIRDFTDVNDMVRAYWLAINQGEAGEVYNLGSGQGRAIEDILNFLLSQSVKKIRIQTDPSLIRPADEQVLICDFGKFNKLTGWKPTIGINDSLINILNYWRKEIS